MNIVWDRILIGYGNALKNNPCATLIFLQWKTDTAGPNSAHELQSMNISWERILRGYKNALKYNPCATLIFLQWKTDTAGSNSAHELTT